MMRLGIMQPYFLPYLGYWQLLKAVDAYVIYDDVNFIKNGWINRNNFLIQGEKKICTIPLADASSFKKINEIHIKGGLEKFEKTMKMNYSKAPYYQSVLPVIESITSFDRDNLSEFICNSIDSVKSYLKIPTKVLISSEIEKNDDLKGADKVVHICQRLGATEYFNASGGQDLYDKSIFSSHGICLKFVQAKLHRYTQFKNEFIPGLSIIDVMMFNSIETINAMLDDYEVL